MNWNPFAWFKEPTVKQMLEKQMYFAQAAYLGHKAEAERHAALANMFEKQAVRLNAEMASVSAPPMNFSEITIPSTR